MEKTISNRRHHAWKIMAACIGVKVGLDGAVHSAMGNFIAPIVADLGCQVSELTMFTSISAISMALLYTTASRMLTTKRPGIIMGIASIAEVIGLALMSTYQSVQMFYLSALIIGVSQAFNGLVAIPVLINMWFHKKAGTVLGTVVSVGSAALIGYNLLSAQLITVFGWRPAYLILAGMGLLLTVPAVFMFVRSPEEMGSRPYGIEEEPLPVSSAISEKAAGTSGLTRRKAFTTPFVYIAWIACVLYSYGSGVPMYITPFARMELGQTINFGARAGMFLSFGMILCSLILGRINDKFGVKAGLVFGTAASVAGYAVMFLSFRNPLFAYAGAFILGLGGSMYTVQCPLLARGVVGSKHYSDIWPIMMVANSFIGGGLNSTIGLFYDKLGSYSGAFIMGALLFIGAMLLGMLSISLGKDRREKDTAAGTV